jgi:hypothetical protein
MERVNLQGRQGSLLMSMMERRMSMMKSNSNVTREREQHKMFCCVFFSGDVCVCVGVRKKQTGQQTSGSILRVHERMEKERERGKENVCVCVCVRVCFRNRNL